MTGFWGHLPSNAIPECPAPPPQILHGCCKSREQALWKGTAWGTGILLEVIRRHTGKEGKA